MKKQTSVEWLVDYLTNIKELPFIRQNLNMNEQNILNDIIEQAKEMDRKEKIKHQLFIGKVSEIIGFEKTVQLLRECNETFNP
jgi:hypothetical protein